MGVFCASGQSPLSLLEAIDIRYRHAAVHLVSEAGVPAGVLADDAPALKAGEFTQG
jgi:hypothetical protein